MSDQRNAVAVSGADLQGEVVGLLRALQSDLDGFRKIRPKDGMVTFGTFDEALYCLEQAIALARRLSNPAPTSEQDRRDAERWREVRETFRIMVNLLRPYWQDKYQSIEELERRIDAARGSVEAASRLSALTGSDKP